MKALVPAKCFSNKASAAVLLFQTYVVSLSASATCTVISREHSWDGGAFCAAPTIPRHGCRRSTFRQSSEVVMSSRRQLQNVQLARTATLLQRTRLFQPKRTRVANTEHRRCSRGDVAVVPLEGAADDSAESPPGTPTGIYVAAAFPITGSLDAAPAGSNAAELGAVAVAAAAGPADDDNGGAAAAAAATPTVSSMKWGMKKKVDGLRRQFFELPEDTAEEGRFLMMAALVGVITGTAGEKDSWFCSGSKLTRK